MPDQRVSDPSEAIEPDMFGGVDAWVQGWLAPTLAGKLSGGNGSGGRVWCPEWWRHPQVAVRLAGLWKAWEAARKSESADAMTKWWTHDADATLRAVCDGEAGPMYRCSAAKHHDLPAFSVVPAPPGWFDPPAEPNS